MASFRTHASFGVALGFLGVMGIFSLAISDDFGLLSSVFLVAGLGSVLPDIDSDSGVPFHVTFGAFSLISGIFLFSELSRQGNLVWWENALWSIGMILFIWVVVGAFFKRCTQHRGMAHSVPSAFLFGLIVFFLASRFSLSDADAFLLAVFALLGYLVHLILDEVYAVVNFDGGFFVPKKSLGSALKFFSHSGAVNLLIYGALVFLLAGNTSQFYNLAVSLWKAVSEIF